MKCPRNQEWDLLVMNTLEGEQAEALLMHARQCPACREVYAAARRDHIERVRMYEAFDREHDDLTRAIAGGTARRRTAALRPGPARARVVPPGRLHHESDQNDRPAQRRCWSPSPPPC